MDMAFKETFLKQWNKYFPKAELPITYYYADDTSHAPYAGVPAKQQCVIGDLAKVRKGKSLTFDVNAVGCAGGKRYLGFRAELRPNFEYFLSCGIEGELEGERYKRTPELVSEVLKVQQPFAAPGKYIVFKRIDKLEEKDEPITAVFFASPDVLSGLFTLTNFDEVRPEGVMAPFGAGCSSIVYWPYHEGKKENPRAVLGMFDVSARPYVPAGVLTFAIPWQKFTKMVGYMDESFLITKSWKKVRTRLNKG
ncbi:MAG TPA: DUF169 domain-containing protein [Candidatus Acidoferrum sp.]|nr:DUF169 domain-containing protein [Candidatus Acidoferrum sp.]